jgi:pimeloyl-ACP methyl ester carboxylesterase
MGDVLKRQWMPCKSEDLATPADVQRRRVKDETRVVEFAAGHHPFLARPDEFAQGLIATIDHN